MELLKHSPIYKVYCVLYTYEWLADYIQTGAACIQFVGNIHIFMLIIIGSARSYSEV